MGGTEIGKRGTEKKGTEIGPGTLTKTYGYSHPSLIFQNGSNWLARGDRGTTSFPN